MNASTADAPHSSGKGDKRPRTKRPEQELDGRGGPGGCGGTHFFGHQQGQVQPQRGGVEHGRDLEHAVRSEPGPDGAGQGETRVLEIGREHPDEAAVE